MDLGKASIYTHKNQFNFIAQDDSYTLKTYIHAQWLYCPILTARSAFPEGILPWKASVESHDQELLPLLHEHLLDMVGIPCGHRYTSKFLYIYVWRFIYLPPHLPPSSFHPTNPLLCWPCISAHLHEKSPQKL